MLFIPETFSLRLFNLVFIRRAVACVKAPLYMAYTEASKQSRFAAETGLRSVKFTRFSM